MMDTEPVLMMNTQTVPEVLSLATTEDDPVPYEEHRLVSLKRML